MVCSRTDLSRGLWALTLVWVDQSTPGCLPTLLPQEDMGYPVRAHPQGKAAPVSEGLCPQGCATTKAEGEWHHKNIQGISYLHIAGFGPSYPQRQLGGKKFSMWLCQMPGGKKSDETSHFLIARVKSVGSACTKLWQRDLKIPSSDFSALEST